MSADQGRSGLSKEQKIGVILLSIFSVFAIGLGILQIRNTMYAPFALNNNVPPLAKDDISSNETLMYRDTDKDGLNDFDELYVYSTSPYLADTDSDGISDKAEVDSGTNPLCPEGQSCAEVGANADAVPGNASMTASSSVLGIGSAPQDLDKTLNDPAQVRKILATSGLDPKVLEQTTDADLMKMVKEILSSASSTSKPQ
ncbi:MAG TPA: thrombospondin type 3 repeat-containing protein [Candidatus Udaeobacter sp.]|nr:thrombospondin type 3 repeat-containing protein [Candidatus Udaeobacter sp.]